MPASARPGARELRAIRLDSWSYKWASAPRLSQDPFPPGAERAPRHAGSQPPAFSSPHPTRRRARQGRTRSRLQMHRAMLPPSGCCRVHAAPGERQAGARPAVCSSTSSCMPTLGLPVSPCPAGARVRGVRARGARPLVSCTPSTAWLPCPASVHLRATLLISRRMFINTGTNESGLGRGHPASQEPLNEPAKLTNPRVSEVAVLQGWDPIAAPASILASS